jgi:DNA mismatch endonuclease (patch repair protein)
VFPSRRKVIFVHGCFWHGHGCSKGQLPKSRPEYWGPKIQANQARDKRAVASLAEAGWKSLTLWQCDTVRNVDELKLVLNDFLGPPGVVEGVNG